MCNYFRFGGVARDLPEGMLPKMPASWSIDRLPRKVDELDRYLTENEIVRARCIGVGVSAAEQAIAYQPRRPGAARLAACPTTSAAPSRTASTTASTSTWRCATNGDVYDRYLIRLDEIRQSLRILAAGAAPDARRRDPGRQAAVPGAGAGGRGLRPGREPQGRAGLLRGLQRQAQPLALSRPRARPSST